MPLRPATPPRLGLALALAAALAAPRPAAPHDPVLLPAPPGITRTLASYAVPAVPMTDMDGRRVNLASELNGDLPILLNFVFTSCNAVCPVASHTFAQVQQALAADGRRFRLVSISIDPEEDTPFRLKAYARRYQAGPNWRFLTGDTARTLAVQRAFDAWRGGKMSHVPLTFVRARPGAPWVRYEGFVEADTLVQEVRRLSAPIRVVQR